MSSVKQIDTELADVAQRILDLQNHERTLKTRRNSLTLICRIPNDVLLRIFSILVQLDHPSLLAAFRPRGKPTRWGQNTSKAIPHPHGPDSTAWAHITWVCTHIRRVALDTPLLWRHIDFERRAWARLCLERSGTVPIFACVWGSFDEEALRAAAHRMQRLSVSAAESQTREATMNAFLKSELPLLETLHNTSGGAFELSDRFLSGQASKLTSLSLTNGLLTGSTPSLPALTHLTLRSMTVAGSFEALFNLLDNAPGLTDLLLMAMVPSQRLRDIPASTNQPTTRECVSLPKLASVYLYNTILHTSAILSGLPNPLASLYVAPTGQDMLQSNSSPSWSSTIARIYDFAQYRSLTICAVVVRKLDEASERERIFDLQLVVKTNTHPDSTYGASGETAGSKRSSKRRVLFQCISTFGGFLDALRDATYVELSCWALQQIGRSTRWNAAGVDAMVLPRLTHLVLQDVQYHVVDRNLARQELLRELGGPDAWVASIVAWLTRRSKTGHRVQMLELLGKEDYYASIRELATTIEASGAVDEVKCSLSS
jgi:hypothetical protein